MRDEIPVGSVINSKSNPSTLQVVGTPHRKRSFVSIYEYGSPFSVLCLGIKPIFAGSFPVRQNSPFPLLPEYCHTTNNALSLFALSINSLQLNA